MNDDREPVTAQAKAAAARLGADLLLTLTSAQLVEIPGEDDDPDEDLTVAICLGAIEWTSPNMPTRSVVLLLTKPQLVDLAMALGGSAIQMGLGPDMLKPLFGKERPK